MIKCNLAVVMAERGLKIVDIVNETGISKTTIRALYHNAGKGVQFETMETLCAYLDITPGELFTYQKFSILVTDVYGQPSESDKWMVGIECIFNDGEREYTGRIHCFLRTEKNAFVMGVWNKLFNRLTKIPQRYIADVLIEEYTKYTGKPVTGTPEWGIYDTGAPDVYEEGYVKPPKERTPN